MPAHATPGVPGTRSRRLLVPLVLVLAVGSASFAVSAASVPAALESPPVVAAVRAAPPEALLGALINQERAGSVRSLRMFGKLIKIARRHSARMAAAGGIYHNPRLAQNARRIRWSILGENVGVGGSIESLHQAFMNSPPHRENVMRSRFRRVGVGVVERDGRLWVTVVFLG